MQKYLTLTCLNAYDPLPALGKKVVKLAPQPDNRREREIECFETRDYSVTGRMVSSAPQFQGFPKAEPLPPLVPKGDDELTWETARHCLLAARENGQTARVLHLIQILGGIHKLKATRADWPVVMRYFGRFRNYELSSETRPALQF